MVITELLTDVSEHPAFWIFATALYTAGFIGAARLVWLRFADKKRRKTKR